MASTQNFVNISSTANASNLSSSNQIDVNRQILNVIESNTPNKVLFIVYSLSDKQSLISFTNSTFRIPKYIMYRQNITYSDYTHPINLTSNYALKIYAYLQITNDDTYTISYTATLTHSVRLYINGFLLLDGTESPVIDTRNIYLRTGVYQLYIEKLAESTDKNLDIFINPSSAASKTDKIDKYIHPSLNYTLLSNAITAKNDGTTAFCKTGTNIFGNDNICNTSLTSESLLKDVLKDYCFPNEGIKKGADNKIDTDCKKEYNTANINTDVKTTFKTQYNTWASKILKTNAIDDNKDALYEYITTETPSKDDLFGTGNNAPNELIKYCDGKIGDNYSASSTATTLCDKLYTDTTYNNDKKIADSINKKKRDFCTKNDINGKPRYETNDLCKRDYTGLLKNTITSRCVQNNLYNKTDEWCNALSDENINNSDELYTTLNQKRTEMAKTDLNSAVSDMSKAKLQIDSNSYKYIIGKYNDNPNKKLTDEILTHKLFDFCENKEPNYPSDPNSQCAGIYNKFASNDTVKQSKLKMRDSLCKLPENITTTNTDSTKTNALNCSSTIFNTSDNIGKFANTVNTYCGMESNISSQLCQTYYNNIEDKILQFYGIKSSVPSTTTTSSTSPFQNMYTYKNKYENIELDSFQNNSEPEVTNESEVNTEAEVNVEPEMNNDHEVDGAIFCTNTSEDMESSNFMYYLLLVILFVICIGFLFNSCRKNYPNKKKSVTESNIITKT